MNIILLGVQGSGKGTQAKLISGKKRLTHISTGDLLRNTKGKLKEQIDSYINKGNLVPDELMLKILKNKIDDCKKGFILDGFPRNLKQAEMLNKITKIDKVIEIFISDREAIERISGRRNCSKCGKIYNIYKSPKPKKDELCDDCNVKLSQRADDNIEAVKKRIETYHKETELILKLYPSVRINGEQDIEKANKEILEVLK
ncbi:MAG: nucleoside monophosphate kinase [Candidatus Pacearchaeota archaeon]